MPYELTLAGLLSGVAMVAAGLVVLARTHGPELSLAALCGWADLLLGSAAAACAVHGSLPWWAVPVVLVMAVLAVWAVAGGRRRPRIVRRCTGFGGLDA